MKKKILVTYPLSPKRLEALNTIHQVDCINAIETKYEEVHARVQDYDAIHCIGLKTDKQIMDKGGDRLKLISNYGVGYDNIDADYAKSVGIVVANTPTSTSRATAEYTLGLILSLLRKITLNDKKVRQGILTDWSLSGQSGNSVYGKKLGIFGMGRIGKEVTKMAKVFGMNVIYYSRTKLSESEEAKHDISYVSFDQLMAESDIVSIHAPLTSDTHHIINLEKLQLMKPTSWLVNTARGKLVDQEALINILENHKIAGAALDVFSEEPQVPEAFIKMEHVVLSPHNGTGTDEDRAAMFQESFQNILDFFAGKEFEGRVC